MVLLLHGDAGGWDELLIALVAFAVLWIAVKLAGRKPAADADADDGSEASEPGATSATGQLASAVQDGPGHPPPGEPVPPPAGRRG